MESVRMGRCELVVGRPDGWVLAVDDDSERFTT